MHQYTNLDDETAPTETGYNYHTFSFYPIYLQVAMIEVPKSLKYRRLSFLLLELSSLSFTLHFHAIPPLIPFPEVNVSKIYLNAFTFTFMPTHTLAYTNTRPHISMKTHTSTYIYYIYISTF